MKRKFAASVAMGFVLILGTASGIRLFGQQSANGPDTFQPRTANQ